MTEGIDVASYQPAQPVMTGRAFLISKCTESTNYVNPRYAAQIAYGRKLKKTVGHYHFVRPGSMSAQLAYFKAHADVRAGEIVALDWEDNGVSGAEKDAWLKAAEKAFLNNRVILYCNVSFWKSLDKTGYAAAGLWIADPSAAKGSPRVTAPWLFHQYGENNGYDLDYYPGTAAQLAAWAHGTQEDPNDMADITRAQMTEIATISADLVTSPKYRDALAGAFMYWLVRVLDPRIPLPSGSDAPGVAVQVANARTAIASLTEGLGLTDDQLNTMSDRITGALVRAAQSNTPNV